MLKHSDIVQVSPRDKVREQDELFVIEPVPPVGCDLSKLLAGITPDNLHAEVDYGVLIGKK